MNADEEICINYFIIVINHENQLDTLHYVFLTGPSKKYYYYRICKST